LASVVGEQKRTPRERLLSFLTKTLGDDRHAASLAHHIDNLVDVPGGLYDAGTALGIGAKQAKVGQYKDAALNMASGAASIGLGFVAPEALAETGTGLRALTSHIPPAPYWVPPANRALAKEMFMEGSHAPPVMYMGRKGRRNPGEATTVFESRTGKGEGTPVAGWAAYDPKFADQFSGVSGSDPSEFESFAHPKQTPTTYPLHVRATNPFDIATEEHRNIIGLPHFDQRGHPHSYSWTDIEGKLPEIKNAGFDSYYDYEHGTHNLQEAYDLGGTRSISVKRRDPTGIAVFDSSQLKSPFAERYDPRHPDIGQAKGGVVIDDGNPAKRRKLI